MRSVTLQFSLWGDPWNERLPAALSSINSPMMLQIIIELPLFASGTLAEREANNDKLQRMRESAGLRMVSDFLADSNPQNRTQASTLRIVFIGSNSQEYLDMKNHVRTFMASLDSQNRLSFDLRANYSGDINAGWRRTSAFHW